MKQGRKIVITHRKTKKQVLFKKTPVKIELKCKTKTKIINEKECYLFNEIIETSTVISIVSAIFFITVFGISTP